MKAAKLAAIFGLFCAGLMAAVPQAASREELDAFGLAYDAPTPLQKIKACERFLSRYPHSALVEKAWELEFQAFLERNDVRAALRVGRQIIAVEPNQAEILAKLSVMAPSPDESAQYASRAIRQIAAMRRPETMSRARYIAWKRETLARAHVSLGRVALSRKDASEAAREFAAAVKLEPVSAQYWKFLGLARLQLNQNAEAAAAFQEALARQEDLPGLHLLLGMARFYTRDYSGSLANMMSALGSGQPPREAYLFLMRDYVALDRLNLEVAERGVAQFPHDIELLFETGEAALDHVRSLARRANSLGPQSREFQELEVRRRGTAPPKGPSSALASEYDGTAALLSRCFETVLADAPDSVYGWRVRGYLAESQNHVEEALKDYRAGGDHFAAGRLLAQNVRYEEAAEEFRAELTVRPDNHLALAQLSQLYVQIDKPALARPILDRLLRLYPGDAYAWLDKGRIEQTSGDWQQAAASFKKAVELDPNLKQARYRLATAYRHLGNSQAAADELRAFSARLSRSEVH